VLPDPAERSQRSPGHFAPILEYGLRFGTVLTTAGDPTGAAVCLPPGDAFVTDDRAVEAGLDKLPDALGADAAERFSTVLAVIDPFHRDDVPANHWFVLVLGVEPNSQGQGLGRALLTPILDDARRNNLPCYLETAQPKNVQFYQHLRFRVLRDILDEGSGLRLWTFRVDP
jgi:GNAT superfamily N-acetyltransferase